MSGFSSNIAAINAARKQFGKGYKDAVTIEKLNGEWHVQIKQIAPEETQPQANDAALTITAEDKTAEVDDNFIATQQAEADQAATQAQIIGVSDAPKGKVWVVASVVPKPTKLVWVIADEMIAAAAAKGEARPSRGAIQDECVRRGIASGTARTQYQAWKHANDNARANEKLAAELSAKHNGRK